MTYDIAYFWPFLLVVLLIGGFVGGATWIEGRWEGHLSRWMTGWIPTVALCFIIGLLLAVAHILSGRPGLWLETALLAVFAYVAGCFVGGGLRSLTVDPTLVSSTAVGSRLFFRQGPGWIDREGRVAGRPRAALDAGKQAVAAAGEDIWADRPPAPRRALSSASPTAVLVTATGSGGTFFRAGPGWIDREGRVQGRERAAVDDHQRGLVLASDAPPISPGTSAATQGLVSPASSAASSSESVQAMTPLAAASASDILVPAAPADGASEKADEASLASAEKASLSPAASAAPAALAPNRVETTFAPDAADASSDHLGAAGLTPAAVDAASTTAMAGSTPSVASGPAAAATSIAGSAGSQATGQATAPAGVAAPLAGSSASAGASPVSAKEVESVSPSVAAAPIAASTSTGSAAEATSLPRASGGAAADSAQSASPVSSGTGRPGGRQASLFDDKSEPGAGAKPAASAPAASSVPGALSGRAPMSGAPSADASAALSAAHPGDKPPSLDVARDGGPDDLKLIKGIGPKNEAACNALGVYHFSQIADWSSQNAAWVGHHIAFPGRIEREHWIAQAKLLSVGIDTAHSAGVRSGAIKVDERADAPLSDADAAAVHADMPAFAAPVEDEGKHAGARPLGFAAPQGGTADDLKRIRGIGKQNEARLHGLGVWHFDQIAGWSADNVRWIGSYLAFPGRITREQWTTQAAELAAGRETPFSKRVAAGLVKTSVDDGSKGQGNVAGVPPRSG